MSTSLATISIFQAGTSGGDGTDHPEGEGRDGSEWRWATNLSGIRSLAGWQTDFFPPEQQAGYVARSYLLNWAAGVDRFYWYAWDSHKGSQIEVVKPDNATPSVAGRAYVTVQAWMAGAVMKRCSTPDNHTWICEMDRSGSPKYIVWNTDGDRPFNLSKDWHVTQFTRLNGTINKIAGNSVQIGIQPLLVE